MLQEYLNRTFFVCLHGGLLAFYFILLGRSYFQLRRERKTLRQLAEDWNEDVNAGDTDVQHHLARLKEELENGPPTALNRQLRAIVGTTTAGEDFDTQRVLAQLGRSLAATDDVIRFCINGLVIVGLMGTLYAFYQMWGTHGTANLTAGNSTLYLESMSTALLVSLVGLMLALITNFFFALLRARRQALFNEVAAFLVPLAGLVPTDAKTHLLITNLLAPLNELVVQITRQNDHVLRGLTEAVHTRTEQLNLLIEKATADWQAVIGAFRAETLTAVANLQQATMRLADSSQEVAGTMRQVSQSLERTKDIGRVVDQLEASSGQIITTISQRLDAATHDWIATHTATANAYATALQQQSEMVSKVSQDVTSTIREDFKALVAHALAEFTKLKEQLAGSLGAADEQVATTLGGFSGKFIENLELIGAALRTEFASVTDSTTAKLGGIVDGWQVVVEGTAGNVNTALGGSRDLVTEMTNNIAALGQDLQTLHSFAHTMLDKSGGPVYLGQAVERLGQMTEALTALSAKLEYGQALHQLQDAIDASRSEVVAVGRQVKDLGAAQKGENLGVAAQLDGLDKRFKGFDTKLIDLRSDIGRLSQAKRSRPTPILPPPPTFWQRLRQRFVRARKPPDDEEQSFEVEEPKPPGVDAPDESALEEKRSS
ncbi:MAG: hypothetical protein WCF57_19730 [Pyrinomonadaceae bacterium]